MIIDVNKIRIDGHTQSREMKKEIVAQFAQDMENGDTFPPITVFAEGQNYWLADGFHRYFATKRLKKLTIEADVYDGTARDAEWYGMGANKGHGLRPSSADKRKMVIRVVSDPEWQEQSDRIIGTHIGVSHMLVFNIRKELKESKQPKQSKTKKPDENVNIYTKQEPSQIKSDGVAEFNEDEIQREHMQASIQMLRKENEDLQDQLTVVQAASIDDIQKEKAESIIRDLRAQLRAAEIELKEMTISRDMYQRENGELKKQVTSLLKKLKKLEG
jgi:hypothetical protein